MLKMKRKHIVIMTLLVLMVFSMAMTAYAAVIAYEMPVNTTAANKTRTYTNVSAGRVSGYVDIDIVNSGVPQEYFTGKFGSASTGRKLTGAARSFTSGLTIAGGTVVAGVYRDAAGTTIQGYLHAEIN